MKLLPRPSSPTIAPNMHRSPSETSGPSKSKNKWRFGSALSKIHSGTVKDENRNCRPNSDFDSDAAAPLSPAAAVDTTSLSQLHEADYQRLREHVKRLKGAQGSSCDTFYKEYSKVRDACNHLSKVLLTQQAINPSPKLNRESTGLSDRGPCASVLSPTPGDGERTGTSVVSGSTERVSGLLGRAISSIETPSVRSGGFDGRSSFSGGSSAADPARFPLVGVMTSSASTAGQEQGSVSNNVNVAWLAAIRTYRDCLGALAQSLRTSLADTYKQYEPNASSQMIELLFTDRKFRTQAVQRMRNASVYKMLSAAPDYWPKYEIRFRNYEKVKTDLGDMTALLQAGESGISPDRIIREASISPRGDVILEFSNAQAPWQPVYRFRVLSYMLAATSPIFARMFSGHYEDFDVDDEEVELMDELPPPPSLFVCRDGLEAKLYRMPQLETNEHNALSTLLHAAHLHNDKIPREIPFEQFVAIAEACMRYRCTSPLEMVVEHRWLPQWMHKAADDMPDGLLVISHAFGLRGLFTRMTKTAILNLMDEKQLESKSWPRKIKDKIWTVREAKVAQVHACCAAVVEEYIRPPVADALSDIHPPQLEDRAVDSDASIPQLVLSSTPRCPKGSHWCDATNLGWILLVLNELQMINTVLRPNILHPSAGTLPPRSLAQMVNALRLAVSTPHPVHSGAVCNPVPAFRSAINDIYNSVSGLTLYDVSGRRHGWALSRHKKLEPQLALQPSQEGAESQPRATIANLDGNMRLKILSELDSLEDLQSVARIGKPWYQTYKENELPLMKGLLRAGRRAAVITSTHGTVTPINGCEKVLKVEGDLIRASVDREADEEDEESVDVDEEDEESDDEIEVVVAEHYAPTPTRTSTASAVVLPAKASPSDSPPPFSRHDSGLTEADVNGITHEEAERILWPDAPPSSPSQVTSPTSINAVLPPWVEGTREKFRAEDYAFTEAKSLAHLEDKKLREEHDLKVGRGKEKSHGESEHTITSALIEQNRAMRNGNSDKGKAREQPGGRGSGEPGTQAG